MNAMLKTKLKSKPKRPQSAYMLFFLEKRSEILSECLERGDMTTEEVAHVMHSGGKNFRHRKKKGYIGRVAIKQVIAAKWKNLLPEERLRYELAERRDLERCQQELRLWKGQTQQKNQHCQSTDTPTDLYKTSDGCTSSSSNGAGNNNTSSEIEQCPSIDTPTDFCKASDSCASPSSLVVNHTITSSESEHCPSTCRTTELCKTLDSSSLSDGVNHTNTSSELEASARYPTRFIHGSSRESLLLVNNESSNSIATIPDDQAALSRCTSKLSQEHQGSSNSKDHDPILNEDNDEPSTPKCNAAYQETFNLAGDTKSNSNVPSTNVVTYILMDSLASQLDEETLNFLCSTKFLP